MNYKIENKGVLACISILIIITLISLGLVFICTNEIKNLNKQLEDTNKQIVQNINNSQEVFNKCIEKCSEK